MKPKAQFGPLIRTDIGIGPFADISVKDQVRDQMIHRYDMYLEAPISDSIHFGLFGPDIGPREEMRRRTARPVPNPMDQIDPLGEWMVFHATVRYRR